MFALGRLFSSAQNAGAVSAFNLVTVWQRTLKKRPVQPEDEKRASDDQQVTKRSAVIVHRP
jgi:hypothetical protein